MVIVASAMAAFLAFAQDPVATAPSLPYLQNPSVTYRACVAASSRSQANSRVEEIGAGSCRQARAILWGAIRYDVAVNWSSIALNRREMARIEVEIDDSARSIMRSYEADLQRWLDASAGRR